MVLLTLFFLSIFSFAQTPNQLCDFLDTRSKLNPQDYLKSQNTQDKLKEIVEFQKMQQEFQNLSKEGVAKKMTWDKFKVFASKNGKIFSDFFQPEYDKLYFKQYCGDSVTEAGVFSKIPSESRTKGNTRYQFLPVISEHEYSKQVGNNR